MPAKRLPSGGPLKLDPALAKFFISHIDVICQPFGTMRQKKATALRDKLRGQLDSSQRNWGRLIADELAHTLRGNKDPSPSRLWDVELGGQTSRRDGRESLSREGDRRRVNERRLT